MDILRTRRDEIRLRLSRELQQMVGEIAEELTNAIDNLQPTAQNEYCDHEPIMPCPRCGARPVSWDCTIKPKPEVKPCWNSVCEGTAHYGNFPHQTKPEAVRITNWVTPEPVPPCEIQGRGCDQNCECDDARFHPISSEDEIEKKIDDILLKRFGLGQELRELVLLAQNRKGK